MRPKKKRSSLKFGEKIRKNTEHSEKYSEKLAVFFTAWLVFLPDTLVCPDVAVFGQPVEEDAPMLMSLGHDSSAPGSPQLTSGSSEGRPEIPGGTLVHQYLKQNSQVIMSYV